MYYNCKAQSFFLDPDLFKNASTVFLTSVDLYFKSKPIQGRTVSGIERPGVSIAICPMAEGKPEVGNLYQKSIVLNDYGIISVTSDASSPTNFRFTVPVPLKTGQSYCLLIAPLDPDFTLWINTVGEEDINSGQIAKNSSGKADGNLFDITNSGNIDPLFNKDIKFRFNFAKFTSTNQTFKIVNDAYEFFQLSSGTQQGSFIGGEYVYVQQANATGTVSVSSGSSNITGSATDFGNTTSSNFTDKISNNDLILVCNATHSEIKKVNVVTNTTFLNTTSSFATSFSSVNIRTFEKGVLTINSASYEVKGTNTNFSSVLSVGDKIVLTDGTDGNTVVREVLFITSSTSIGVDVKPPFSSSTGGYYKSAVGVVDKPREFNDTLLLYKSNANSTIYFKNNTIVKGVDSGANAQINYIADIPLSAYTTRYKVITPPGTRYKSYLNVANSSFYKVDSNNKEVSINVPYFVENYAATIGSRSNEVLNSSNLFANSKSLNANLQFITDNPYTSPYVLENDLDFTTDLYSINNDSSTESYSNNRFQTAIFNANTDVSNTTDFITVSSNPFVNDDVILYNSSAGNTSVTGLINNQSYFVVSANTSGLKLSLTKGGTPVDITTSLTETGHTLRRIGNAFSKYVSKPITLAKDQIAEDLIVYMTAFKPTGTDIEVYAKIISEEDGDYFNTKNWSKLELQVPFGSVVESVYSNPRDYVNLEYRIPSFQPGNQITAGSFTTQSSNAVILGNFSTVNTYIVAGVLVRIYDPTFSDVFFVDTVLSCNTTTLTLSNPVTNSDLIATGLKIDIITDKNSAFLDNQNFNIVKYYNKGMSEYNGFKTYAIKIVLKSSSFFNIPRVAEYRALAVSA